LSRIAQFGALGSLALTLAHCGSAPGTVDPKYGVSSSPRVVSLGEPVPKGGGSYRVGKPYTLAGRTYVPEENSSYSAQGIASWYGEDFHGRRTANGEIYDMNSISAAHTTLPIPSYARVTNLGNGRSIIVRVNDRGPYHENRVIDLSVRTAKLLGFYDNGIARVKVEYVGRASLQGSDDTKLAATLRHGSPAPVPGGAVMVASSKPFVPEIFDPTPASRSRLSSQVPTPPDRPFDLGHQQTRTAKRIATEPVVAARPQAAPAQARPAHVPPPQAAPMLASARSTPVHAPARQVPETSFDARFAPAANAATVPSRVEPISAYSSGTAARSESALTGRGLY
jgi:rare lipoprotein A